MLRDKGTAAAAVAAASRENDKTASVANAAENTN